MISSPYRRGIALAILPDRRWPGYISDISDLSGGVVAGSTVPLRICASSISVVSTGFSCPK